MLPLLVSTIMPPVIVALYIAAVLSAIMSTIDSLLAVFALFISMGVAVASPERTIFWFIIFGWSGISASFCPMMILSLFWKRYNEKGAIASMVTGFVSVPLFKFVAPGIPVVGSYLEVLSELPPSFVMSMIVGVVVTVLTTNKQDVTMSLLDSDVVQESSSERTLETV